MTGVLRAAAIAGLVTLVTGTGWWQRAASNAVVPTDAHDEVIRRYCVDCHGEEKPKAGFSLANFDVAAAGRNAEVAEKMIHKLRTGLMPPAGKKRPDEPVLTDLADALERRVDELAGDNPNPGRRTFQRLSRAEYRRSVRDLLSLDVDVDAFLPPDTISHGFDNIADVQSMSPALMQGYLRAASTISRLAVGDRDATASEATYKVPRTASQLRHVEGAPFGTRGGTAVVHNFPADGTYVVKIALHSGPTGFLFGLTASGEQIEVSVDGVRAELLDVDRGMHERNPKGMVMQTKPLAVRAGPHRIAAAFLKQREGPVEDLIAPIEHTLADTMIGAASGITTLPHLRDLIVSGPYEITGVSETPSRRTIFTCRPTRPEEEKACATEIISQLAKRAFRRPVTEADVAGLLEFYDDTAKLGGFEVGIRTALQAILTSPHFVFRLERVPDAAQPGTNYRIGTVDLASRLSYFLWASAPDAELAALAATGELEQPSVLGEQVGRMLTDGKAEALATRFATQWLRLQDLTKVHPDALNYPQYDQTLATAMRRETELLFEHIVRHDRSVIELLTADYTFVNERLAVHYGIRNITGSTFRRVDLTDTNRRGLLGHGSILTMTSHANRTSPVLRGKWVLEVLLGSAPPPPPPDVPDLSETVKVGDGRLLTVRERMAEHRRNPSCRSCHAMIDPIGIALENFDVTGAWRIKDAGHPVDATGRLYDGSQLDGPPALRAALLRRQEAFVRNFIENLMAYALGRRLEYFDMPTVRAIARDTAADGHRMTAIIRGVVNSPAFKMTRTEAEKKTVNRSVIR